MTKKDFYNKTYLGNWLNSTSQWLNSWAGYRADVSMSARIGRGKIRREKFYLFLAWVVDNTFLPVEGPGHCEKAYHKDPDEDFDFDTLKIVGKMITCIFIPIGCLVLAVIFYAYALLKFIVTKITK